jgi:hypothetical protein
MEKTTGRRGFSVGSTKENPTMKISWIARTLLAVAALCLPLASAGCNNALTGSGGSAGQAGSTPSESVQGPGDWGMSLLAGGTVGIGMFPAKFTFDVTAAPSCANDFVAFNTSLAGSGTQANIVAYNQLYASQSGSLPAGLCGTSGPSVYWAYNTGTGTAVTSVVISGDGSKVAFVENVGTQATLRILKWKAGEGTGISAPVAPTTTLTVGQNWTTNCPAGNSCIRSIAFSGTAATDTRSEPFYDYNTDALYVGSDGGVLHKFTGVFNGAPAEAGAPWPITVDAATILTGPVYDGVSGNIFVGDSSGRLSFIQEVGSTVGGATPCSPFPCLNTVHLAVGTAGAIVDAPIVDGSTGMVFTVNGTDTSGNRGTILQANTGLVSQFTGAIGGNAAGASNVYSGAFDNAYFTSAKPTIAGHMYVCGKDSAHRDTPYVYQLSFVAATGVLSGVGTRTFASGARWATGSGEACSPVTEFYNPNGGGAGVPKDWIFFSVGNLADNVNTPTPATAINPVPAGACRTNHAGCVMSINVTGNPAWPLTLPSALVVAAPTPANNNGSTSGIVVDNTSTSAQASSFYFSLGTNSTGAGPGVPSCNTTAGVGCAVKLTQSALN